MTSPNGWLINCFHEEFIVQRQAASLHMHQHSLIPSGPMQKHQCTFVEAHRNRRCLRLEGTHEGIINYLGLGKGSCMNMLLASFDEDLRRADENCYWQLGIALITVYWHKPKCWNQFKWNLIQNWKQIYYKCLSFLCVISDLATLKNNKGCRGGRRQSSVETLKVARILPQTMVGGRSAACARRAV